MANLNNRLQLLFPNWIDFTAFATHQKNPNSQVLEAGLSYDDLDLGTKLDLANNESGYEGHFLTRWGPLEQDQTNIRMDFEMRNKQLNDYYIEATLHFPGLETLSASGDMTLSLHRSFMDMKCEMGDRKHEISLEVETHGSGRKVVGAYLSGATSYSMNILTRYDSVKSIHAEVNVDKTYTMNAVVSDPIISYIGFLTFRQIYLLMIEEFFELIWMIAIIIK